MGVTWDNIWNGSTEGGIPEDWGVMGYPTSYLLDRDGVIRAKDLRGAEMMKVVEEVVGRD